MVIVGSVRPGRIGPPIAEWVTDELGLRDDIDIDLVDLAELDLPLMNEPNHPVLRRYTFDHTIAWSERVEQADAFVFVTPEYNHSFSPALKNALDYLNHEWRRKPVTFVSYGGVSAGTRGVVALKPVVTGLGLVPTLLNVEINFPGNQLDDDGAFRPTDSQRERFSGAVGELAELSAALAPLRASVAAAR
ncbi:NADPH-dependent FMN reductase [Herbiconiux sp. L3-i23]|uniref:NADPH-dependent FMN reductase n=1 Tax=Herbiconiux sp. L3-i23 TaxID=2905871 RepID=UPI002072F75B|nr:NAD(P)H-dependent oxidoreductase [Herbiconiux sp. L3-i23]